MRFYTKEYYTLMMSLGAADMYEPVIDKDYTIAEDGVLADIVPTLIEVMGKEQPKEMTGRSLLVKNA